MYVFGGDRHLMSFNDIYYIKVKFYYLEVKLRKCLKLDIKIRIINHLKLKINNTLIKFIILNLFIYS